MSDENKILEKIAVAAQTCFQHHPVLVLGSGASIVHGLRGMGDLAQYLRDNVDANDGEEADAWLLIRTALAQGDGLEETLLKTAAPSSLVSKIVRLTWQAIASDDLALMARASNGEEHFHLSELIRGMFRSNQMVANIVTPNYDRVAEYAADLAGCFHATGFEPGIIRRREGGDRISIHKGSHPGRTVRIWKVHGSLDWFADAQGRVVSLPIPETLPDALDPLIVTPGVSKYERTHDEPFRSAIQGADHALSRAASFLCVGYGFRDRHIQPKIEEMCGQQNVPVVVLARTLTDEAKTFLSRNAGQNYLGLEMADEGTRVFSPEHPDGVTIAKPDLWEFGKFNELVL
ncbi:SIR2 family protein [Jannaschia sp. 2305UL9-9]|uniref:SIR2 family protein n=1 Tax=Jannaschia sp. 2305UL9-9 TaxID=3121638 RepID=UPI0035275DB4